MSNRSSSRSNLVAGTFLLGGILAAIVVSFILSDIASSLGSWNRYEVRFALADGVPGLEPGAPVRVGGRSAGAVERIRFAYDERDGRQVPVGLDVQVRLPSSIALYDDAVAFLDVPLLGAGSSLNLPSAGGETDGSSWLAPGETISGTLAPPGVLAQAGYGEEQKRQVQAMIRDASDTAATVRGWADDYGPRIEPAIAQVEEGISGFRSFAEWLDENSTGWGERVDQILEDVELASAELEPAIELLREDSRLAIADARAVIDSVQVIIDDNSPTIARTINNAEEITARFRDDTLAELSRVLEGASDGVAQFEQFGGRANLLLEEQSPNLRRVMANLRLTSDQVKLAVGEIRSQPWRLLTQPRTRELEQQLLLDSARAYAIAASDLRAASEQLDALLTGFPEADGLEADEIVRLRAGLHRAFERYQAAERALIDEFTELDDE